ncbi:uncharacterized protein LOC135805128 [Sycon ciliatum]|uniref:uncharacterized protein LOC135805128 n=1 Tax=Sycon ciliatum TaxID=27933 RepID=UPI0031F6AB1B
MGSVPSSVRSVLGYRQRRRRHHGRVHPVGCCDANPASPIIIVNGDDGAGEEGFGNNGLTATARHQVFQLATSRSLELFRSPDGGAGTGVAGDNLDGAYAQSLWDLVDGTSLSDAECTELWSQSTAPSRESRSNGWLTLRLFVCAPLHDFHAERRSLHDHAFRVLQHWCEVEHIHLIIVDLFSSLDKEPTSSAYLQLCMEEIDRCTEDGVPTLFLGLMSETLGWIPERNDVPPAVEKQFGWIHGLSLLEMMCVHAVYRNKSPNALFLFRDRSFLDSLPEAARDCYEDVYMQAGVKHFKHKLMERFPEQVITYKCSASVQSQPAGGDSTGSVSPDQGHSAGSPTSCCSSRHLALEGLKVCGNHVQSFFKARIRKQFQTTAGMESPTVDIMERYCKQQNEELSRNVTDYISRPILPHLKAVERQVQAYINQGGPSPLLICSPYPGCGKTGVLSHCVRQLLKNTGHLYTMHGQRGHLQASLSSMIEAGKSSAVFYHFSGAQPRSRDLTVLLQRIWDISELHRFHLGKLPSDLTQLALQVAELLGKRSAERLVIFIDQLDQINDSQSNYLQKWLPRNLPENLRLVLTCSQRETNNKCWKVVRSHYPQAEVIQLEMPRRQDCLSMVRHQLPQSLCSRLGATKLYEFIDMMEDRTPMAVTEACRQLSSFYMANTDAGLLELEQRMETIVHNDLVGMLTDGLVELELLPEFPKVLIAATMCLLHCSRSGLLESELLKMLGAACATTAPANTSHHHHHHRQLTGRLKASKGKFSSESDVARLSGEARSPSSADEVREDNDMPLPNSPISGAHPLRAVPEQSDSGRIEDTIGDEEDHGQSQQSIPERSQHQSVHTSTDDNINSGDGSTELPPPGSVPRSRQRSYNSDQMQAFLEGMPQQRRRMSMPAARSTSALTVGHRISSSLQTGLDRTDEVGDEPENTQPSPSGSGTQARTMPQSARVPGLVHSDWHIDRLGELSSRASFQSRSTQQNPDTSSNAAGTGTAASAGAGMRRRYPYMSKSRYDKRSLFQQHPPPPPPDLPSLVWASLLRHLRPWIRRVGDRAEARWAISHTVYHDVIQAYYFSRSPSDRQEFPFYLNSPEFYNAANSHFGQSQQHTVTTLAHRRASQFNLHLAHKGVEPVQDAEHGEKEDAFDRNEQNGAAVTQTIYGAQHSNHKQLARQRYGWWHERLAGFFEETDDEERRAEELPFHLEETCNVTQLRRCLSRWPTFTRIFNPHDLGILLYCWKQAGGAGAAVVEYRRELEDMQKKASTVEAAFQHTKCAQLMFYMGGLEEAELLLKEALELLDVDGLPKDMATVHLALAEVYHAKVQNMDVPTDEIMATQMHLPGFEQQLSSGTVAEGHMIDTATTHPFVVCAPDDDGMTGFSSELTSFDRGGTSAHPRVEMSSDSSDDKWATYHKQLKQSMQLAAAEISQKALAEAQKAVDLIQTALPSFLQLPRRHHHARHGSDAGISSTSSSRKSSIIVSRRDSLGGISPTPVLPMPLSNRSGHDWWPGGEHPHSSSDRDSERGLLLMARASTLLCKHSQQLSTIKSNDGSDERPKYLQLSQRAANHCLDTYQKLGDVPHQIEALIELATASSMAAITTRTGDSASRAAAPGHQACELRNARQQLEEALSLAVQHIGEDHQLTSQVHHHLAMVLQCQGERSASLQHYRRWASIGSRLYGTDHPVVRRIHTSQWSSADGTPLAAGSSGQKINGQQ